MNKKVFLALLSVALLSVITYAIWDNVMESALVDTNNPQTGETMCTADAMECPDGSYVGRTGPNCEFVCPVQTSTSSPTSVLLETKLNEGKSALDVRVVPLAVVEDSRCPTDVQCIQAGTVRVRAQLVSGLGTATETFTLGTPITTEAEMVTLVSVVPLKKSTQTIAESDYRFIFKIERR